MGQEGWAHLLCTAGNGVESTTAMAGAGANLILFSTGLGTPTGNPVSPVIKISSSTKLAHSFSNTSILTPDRSWMEPKRSNPWENLCSSR